MKLTTENNNSNNDIKNNNGPVICGDNNTLNINNDFDKLNSLKDLLPELEKIIIALAPSVPSNLRQIFKVPTKPDDFLTKKNNKNDANIYFENHMKKYTPYWIDVKDFIDNLDGDLGKSFDNIVSDLSGKFGMQRDSGKQFGESLNEIKNYILAKQPKLQENSYVLDIFVNCLYFCCFIGIIPD